MQKEIEQILAKHDPVGLIKMCAPPDEYSSESLLIADQLGNKDWTVEQIQKIVYNVFVEQFGGGKCYYLVDDELIELEDRSLDIAEVVKTIGDFDCYLPIAEEIKKLLDA
jgi:hypothetical protein